MKRTASIICLILTCVLVFGGCTDNTPSASPRVSPSPVVTHSPTPNVTESPFVSPGDTDNLPGGTDNLPGDADISPEVPVSPLPNDTTPVSPAVSP